MTGWAGHVASMGKRAGAYGDLVEKPEGERQLGRSRDMWENNIKMYLKEVGRGAWTELIWLRKGTGSGFL